MCGEQKEEEEEEQQQQSRGALWSFSLSRWKVSHSTGCIPTAQRNTDASRFYFCFFFIADDEEEQIFYLLAKRLEGRR